MALLTHISLPWMEAAKGHKDSMRIVLLGPYPANPSNIIGGVEATTYCLAKGLSRCENTEVYAVTGRVGLGSLEVSKHEDGLQTIAVPLFGRYACITRFAIEAPRIRRVLREIDPDVIHVHSQIMEAFIALERKWPSVLTVHGIINREAQLEPGRAGMQMRFSCRYERDALRRAKHVIAPTQYVADEISALSRLPKIRIVDNPVDDRFFEIEHRPEDGRILFVGMIRRLKGVDVLIRAVASLLREGVSLSLHIVGPAFDPDYYAELESLIDSENLRSHVHMHGPATLDQVIDHYSKASVVALPSYQETAGIVLAQGCAAGIPAVGSNVGGIPYVLEDGRAGFLVPPGDSAAWAAKLRLLLTDPSLRERMGKDAKISAERRFRLSVISDKTLSVYKEVVGDRQAAKP